jgi:hypothetical protein
LASKAVVVEVADGAASALVGVVRAFGFKQAISANSLAATFDT